MGIAVAGSGQQEWVVRESLVEKAGDSVPVPGCQKDTTLVSQVRAG